jgi:uncharacterized protein
MLTCQRCLEALNFPMDSVSEVVLVRDAAELAALDSDVEGPVDVVVAGPGCDVMSIVEDEAILVLPMSPLHPEGECRAPAEAGESDGWMHPFLALRALQDGRD